VAARGEECVSSGGCRPGAPADMRGECGESGVRAFTRVVGERVTSGAGYSPCSDSPRPSRRRGGFAVDEFRSAIAKGSTEWSGREAIDVRLGTSGTGAGDEGASRGLADCELGRDPRRDDDRKRGRKLNDPSGSIQKSDKDASQTNFGRVVAAPQGGRSAAGGSIPRRPHGARSPTSRVKASVPRKRELATFVLQQGPRGRQPPVENYLLVRPLVTHFNPMDPSGRPSN
jgi:hypothetical protein